MFEMKTECLNFEDNCLKHIKIDIKFRITNSILMDRKYPNALEYIKIEAVIWVKQKLWAVKIWAKMIWEQPSSYISYNTLSQTKKRRWVWIFSKQNDECVNFL